MEQTNSVPVDEFSSNVFSFTPPQNSRPESQVSDGSKAGATLLFSGIFLGLVGIAFTVIGSMKREGENSFEWTQLIGPIMLTVGVLFALIPVCRFKLHICKSRRRNEETTPDGEMPSSPQSFVFSGINQPITFHGATVLQYIPPPYTTQDVSTMGATSTTPLPNAILSNGAMSPLCPPQYYSIYPMDNPAFVGDDTFLTLQSTGDAYERSPAGAASSENPQETITHRDPPPLYQDIFPEIK
ncbi:Hypothetical predicted protein [Pelobates cultripes]|uniref:Transmembrane protein 174 n=1 Tax=Pelobates cultripes TaxID=61616 RepID=A0AAD1WC20_PELCU|nr:Hypothetical predicted protein [Pelobates cultripes]